MPDPVTGIISAATTLVSGGLSYLGAKEQSEAIEEAAKSTENWQRHLLALEEKKWDEARRFRDLAYKEATLRYGALTKTMPLLEQDILRKPGTSPLFKEAVAGVSAGLAPYGLSPRSSAFERGYADLLARDIENVREGRFRLAGLGETGAGTTGAQIGSEAMGLLGYGTEAQSQLTSLIGTQGAVTGGLYGSMGQTISQIPLMYALLK